MTISAHVIICCQTDICI